MVKNGLESQFICDDVFLSIFMRFAIKKITKNTAVVNVSILTMFRSKWPNFGHLGWVVGPVNLENIYFIQNWT